ncbi:MAG: 30S ribosomal protein S8 [Candidatus Pacearchaeota archaeon]
MSQDIVADALNMMFNAKRARKENVIIKRYSNLLIEILKIMKRKGAIKRYKIGPEEKLIKVSLGDFLECKAIKPRFSVNKNNIEKYKRRYLPARDLGTIIISTNKGLMTHEESSESNTWGVLIAYFY